MQSQVFIGTSGCVLCLSAHSGQELWRTPLEHSALGANAHKDVTVLDDEDHVFAGSSGHLYCLDAKTGEILWKNDLKGLGFQNISISINGSAIEILTKIEPM